MEEKSIEIIRRKSLTKGQQDLYDLILIKLEKEEPILFIEAKDIYIQKVCKNIIDGIPHQVLCFQERYIGTDGNEHTRIAEKNFPLLDYELTNRVLMWLTSNIGTLVLKGYLKVIPSIEIKNLI